MFSSAWVPFSFYLRRLTAWLLVNLVRQPQLLGVRDFCRPAMSRGISSGLAFPNLCLLLSFYLLFHDVLIPMGSVWYACSICGLARSRHVSLYLDALWDFALTKRKRPWYGPRANKSCTNLWCRDRNLEGSVILSSQECLAWELRLQG